MLGWAILVFQGSLFFTDRSGGSDHRLGFLLARLGAGRAPAMTAIDAPVQPRSSRLRRFGTGCLGLALIYLCFEWTRIGAITQAIRIVSRPIVSRPYHRCRSASRQSDQPRPLSCPSIGALLVFCGSVIAHGIGAATFALSVVVMFLTVH
jgi:hypothetical protein